MTGFNLISDTHTYAFGYNESNILSTGVVPLDGALIGMRFDNLVNMNYFQFILVGVQENFEGFIQDYPIIEENML